VRVERKVELDAPPEKVYDLVMDPHRLEEWVTIHHKLGNAPNGTLEQGDEVTQTMKLAGRKFKVRWTVVENKPCDHVVWEGKGPVFSHARVMYDFEPSSDGHGTAFSYTNEYDLPGGALGKIAGNTVTRITGKEVDASLQKLKSLVE
jgi:carbon monoxide dehydrogenase subunit G